LRTHHRYTGRLPDAADAT